MSCSPCNVPAAFSQSCKGSAGGNSQRIYIAEACQITAYTFDAVTGLLTDVTFDTGGAWKEIDVRRFSVDAQQEHQEANGTLLQSLTFAHNLLSDNVDLEQAAKEAMEFFDSLRTNNNGLVAIVEQSSGVRYLYGFTKNGTTEAGLLVSTATSASGVALADASGMTVTLSHTVREAAKVVDPTFVADTTPAP